MLPPGPAGVVLPMVFFSMIAGAIACRRGRADAQELASGFGPRVGIRAALIAALTGGSLTVFAASLHALGIGRPAAGGVWLTLFALVLPGTRPFQILLLVLLGFPPSMFFGTAGSLIAAMLGTAVFPSEAGGKGSAARTASVRSGLLITILTLSAIGFLSPFAQALLPRAKPIAVAPVIAPPPLSAPAPKWRYEKPHGFDTAEADHFTITKRQDFGEVNGNAPIVLSPDELLLAYSAHTSTVEIRNLDTLDVIAHADTPQPPDHIAWSPDGKRLLFSIEGQMRRLQVFDLASDRVISLPQPVDSRLPDGRPFWWDASEVLFTSSAGPRVLSLETLRVYPVSASATWKALPEAEREAIGRGEVPASFPGTSRWQMSAQPVVSHYVVPANTSAKWTITESLNLAFLNPKIAYRAVQPGVDFTLGDLLIMPLNGTKFIHVRDGRAAIYYFGLTDAPAGHFKVGMPSPPEPPLADALSKKGVCAFVCAPVVNPLNGKTVGPNRDQVKAIARFESWKGKDAELWIQEYYLPISPGDVVADLHTWEGRLPRAAGDLGKNEWFTVIDKLDNARAPKCEDAPTLDR